MESQLMQTQQAAQTRTRKPLPNKPRKRATKPKAESEIKTMTETAAEPTKRPKSKEEVAVATLKKVRRMRDQADEVAANAVAKHNTKIEGLIDSLAPEVREVFELLDK